MTGSAGPVVGSVVSTTVSPFALTCGAPTSATPGSAARRCASPGMSSAASPVPFRSATTSRGALKPGPKPSASRSYARRSVALVRLSPAFGKPVFNDNAGEARSRRRSDAPTRYGHGRAAIRWASRHHAVASAGFALRRRPTIRPASMRSPSSDSSAGSSVSAVAMAKSTMSDVASPMEVRKPTPVSARAAIETMTVPPAKKTAVPDEPMAADSAWALTCPAARFSRYRDTMNRE